MQKRNRRRKKQRGIPVLALAVIFVAAAVGFLIIRQRGCRADRSADLLVLGEGCPPLDVQLLTPNEYSRPQIPLEKVKGIVVHYTGNPGSSAQSNRNYFERLKEGEEGTFASSHFIIGLEGEIIQCIPSTEIAYTSNERNGDTLSIECCHPDESGEFTASTYRSLVELTAWLCRQFEVPVQEVIRHYDVTGKICPKYFVEDEAAWEQFKMDVQAQIEELV